MCQPVVHAAVRLGAVVNGLCEADWDQAAAVAARIIGPAEAARALTNLSVAVAADDPGRGLDLVRQAVALARGVARDTAAEGGADEATRLHRDRYEAAVAIYLAEVSPRDHADLVIDNEFFDRPRASSNVLSVPGPYLPDDAWETASPS